MKPLSHLMLPLVLTAVLLACTKSPEHAPATSSEAGQTTAESIALAPVVWPSSETLAIESAVLLANAEAGQPDRIIASLREGLLLLDASGHHYGQLNGRMTGLDSRVFNDQQVLLSSFDRTRQQAMLVLVEPATGQFSAPRYLPQASFGVEDLCLYRDPDSNVYLNLIGEEGAGEQWLVGQHGQLFTEARLVRHLNLPPTASFCAVDDQNGQLYVNEEGVGIWAYPAHPETDPARRPIDLVAPFGQLQSAADLAVVPGGLLLLDSKQAQLHRYVYQQESWQTLPPLSLQPMTAPETLAVQLRGNDLQLLIGDDEDKRYYSSSLPWQHNATAAITLPTVQPERQTEPVMAEGDAADDPAIWQHPSDASKSRILATDKKYGLMVYDLNGKRLQTLASGDLNNIDLRTGFSFGGKTIALAVASKRNDNSLALFAINTANGEVSAIGSVATTLNEIYGICLYSPAPGEIHAIPNDKDGRFQQIRLHANNGTVQGELLREFKVAGQPEACVADDIGKRLYVGEEDAAVWTLAADADQPSTMEAVIKVGELLRDDVEGIGFYRGKQHSYLVISSQGNDSYVVVDAAAPYQARGAFRVTLNAGAGIDGASETDGLDVNAGNFGGAFSDGLLVVQDGRKRLPQGKQNFKYIAWRDVKTALQLD